MTMADTIAVMNQGKVEQMGAPTELYENPMTTFVANFLGQSNFFDGDISERSGEHAVVYGRPALAMAVNRNAQTLITMDGADETVSFDLPNLQAQKESFTLRALRDFHGRVERNYEEFLAGRMPIREVLHKPVDLFQYAFVTVLDGLHLKMGGGVNVRLNSNIPIE